MLHHEMPVNKRQIALTAGFVGYTDWRNTEMEKAELYRLRAEDYARSFESLRSIEWRVAFQVYVGYAAISLGYSALLEKNGPSWIVTIAACVVTAIMFITTLYLSIRVQERMHTARQLQNEYLSQLDELAGDAAPEKSSTLQGRFWFATHTPPIHGKWYAFLAQTTISVTWALGIIAFAILTAVGLIG